MNFSKEKIKNLIKSWQFWLGVFAVVLSVFLCVAIFDGDIDIENMANYGYIGAFLVSIIGGAISVIPVPMMIVQFSLGGSIDPWFGPQYLAPLCVGIVSGIGEGIGCLVTYYTGVTGSMALSLAKEDQEAESSRIKRWTHKLIRMMGKHGMFVIFILAAIPNPIYYTVAIASGAMRYSKKKFLLMSILGKIIKSAVIAYCGFLGITAILN